LSHLYIKCMILPRQAREKHRENSKKVPLSLRRQALEGLPLRRRDSCGSACAREDRLHTARSPRGPALSRRPSSCVCGLRRCMVRNKRSRSGCCIALAFVPSLSREILLASFVGLLNRRGCVCVCVWQGSSDRRGVNAEYAGHCRCWRPRWSRTGLHMHRSLQHTGSEVAITGYLLRELYIQCL
jgi:hypothetical protein